MKVMNFISSSVLEHILSRIPHLNIGVVGDLFLDRYLDIAADLTEASLETGLDAYQVVGVRASPGAAGTVINNLAALGLKRIFPISVIGDDGEGYELIQALERQGITRQWIQVSGSVRTPTYTKPLLQEKEGPPRELNRLDIKNRNPLPAPAQEKILAALADLESTLDALIVSDQVSEPDCGVISARVRQGLAQMGARNPAKVILADSRERIGLFRSVWLKPNQKECVRAILGPQKKAADVAACATELARHAGRPVFCTRGSEGILVVDPRLERSSPILVPTRPVTGPIDPVGAGDSVNAALVCALAAGGSLVEAAAFANLAASITIQQIGTTGTAGPEQIRQALGDSWAS